MEPTPDRRANQRYALQLPGALRPAGAPAAGRALHVLSRDISSGGAFFVGSLPLAPGDALCIEMSMAVHAAADLANLVVRGRVLRVEPRGVAVAFDKQYRLYPVGAHPHPEAGAGTGPLIPGCDPVPRPGPGG